MDRHLHAFRKFLRFFLQRNSPSFPKGFNHFIPKNFSSDYTTITFSTEMRFVLGGKVQRLAAEK
jgi:hypothetical protein